MKITKKWVNFSRYSRSQKLPKRSQGREFLGAKALSNSPILLSPHLATQLVVSDAPRVAYEGSFIFVR